jgi:hypothetical protein
MRGTWLVVLLIGCSNAGPSDGGDVVVDAPTDGVDAPNDVGLDVMRCSGPDGATTCGTGAAVHTCCHGILELRGYDGPCTPRLDSGVIGDAGSPCDVDPQWPGCPCPTEGALSCDFTHWRRVCEGGIWVEETGFVCC